MLTLETVQRSLIWGSLGGIILAVAFFAALRLLARVNEDRDPTIVGGIVLVKQGQKLGSVPLFVYVGDVYSRSAVIGMSVKGGTSETTVRVLYSNIVAGGCSVENAVLLGEPRGIGSDTAFYSFHQAHVRTIYAIDATIAPNVVARISCNVSDPPERETFTTRRIAFSPPLNKDITDAAGEGGFALVWPVIASIQRVTESTGFGTSGGEPVHNDTLASVLEASALTAQDPILRAFWTDERARSWQTFWLFFWAASASLGFGMLVEAARPFIEMIGHSSKAA